MQYFSILSALVGVTLLAAGCSSKNNSGTAGGPMPLPPPPPPSQEAPLGQVPGKPALVIKPLFDPNTYHCKLSIQDLRTGKTSELLKKVKIDTDKKTSQTFELFSDPSMFTLMMGAGKELSLAITDNIKRVASSEAELGTDSITLRHKMADDIIAQATCSHTTIQTLVQPAKDLEDTLVSCNIMVDPSGDKEPSRIIKIKGIMPYPEKENKLYRLRTTLEDEDLTVAIEKTQSNYAIRMNEGRRGELLVAKNSHDTRDFSAFLRHTSTKSKISIECQKKQ